MRRIILAVALLGIWGQTASAQVNTTPPVLVDFKMSPVLFDTSQGNVRVDICITVADNLSGVRFVTIAARPPFVSRPIIIDRLFLYPGNTAPTQMCFSLRCRSGHRRENMRYR